MVDPNREDDIQYVRAQMASRPIMKTVSDFKLDDLPELVYADGIGWVKVADIIDKAEVGALHLVSRIRWALGDNGKRMQDELIEYCQELARRNGDVERDGYGPSR